MNACKYTTVYTLRIIQLCKCASKQVFKYEGMQVCKYVCTDICMYAHMTRRQFRGMVGAIKL